uniref:TIL domain-containing protein n=1 Tax=Panagrolaimus sp. PS1159 TaxID=55785 RepID=A0AC35FIE8_9BILA
MKFIIFSIFFLAVSVCVFADTNTNPQKCPENSKWNECGTACPTTCKQQTPPPCTKHCHPSCQCEDGRLWNESFFKTQCPPPCTKQCHPSCQCEDGWNESVFKTQCVLISECPKIPTTSSTKL